MERERHGAAQFSGLRPPYHRRDGTKVRTRRDPSSRVRDRSQRRDRGLLPLCRVELKGQGLSGLAERQLPIPQAKTQAHLSDCGLFRRQDMAALDAPHIVYQLQGRPTHKKTEVWRRLMPPYGRRASPPVPIPYLWPSPSSRDTRHACHVQDIDQEQDDMHWEGARDVHWAPCKK